MGERVKVEAKKPEVKRENVNLRMHGGGYSRSMDTGVERILYLQKTVGNQAVQKLVRSGALQAKLRIGQPGDKYEQEADRVADAVMRMPEPGVQRQVEPGEKEEEEILQTKPPVDQITPVVQRQVEEEEEMLQAKSREDTTPEVTNDLESQINAIKGGGRPLSWSERSFFEPRFGTDFSNVRVHNDTRVASIARSVNASAFTFGHNVVFGVGEYSSDTLSGRQLLAHELTHVVQQRSHPGSGGLVVRRRTVRHNYATSESELGPLCDVRLAVTSAPRSDTDDLTDFIHTAMDGIRYACGTLPRTSSLRIRVTMPYHRRDLYSDVSQRAYIAARISVLGRAADPAYIAEQARIAAERARVAQLHSNYLSAMRTGNWQLAAEYLNGFNDTDIVSRLRRLSLTQLGELRRGSVTNPRLGGGARLTGANRDAGRVAALIDGYESALAASDWAAAAEYLNGFSKADIRERLRRLSRIQLSGLRDGAIRNPRLGRGARLVGLIDSVTAHPLLLGVGAACFDGVTITVTKNRTTSSCPAFTGSTGAPTPNGRFCIRLQGEAQIAGGIIGRIFQDRNVWFLIEPQFRTIRSRMQLHPGTRSSGCITVNNRACFNRLATVLNSPGTDIGRGYDGYPPGNSAGVTNPERSINCVAWLDVTSTRGSCSP